MRELGRGAGERDRGCGWQRPGGPGLRREGVGLRASAGIVCPAPRRPWGQEGACEVAQSPGSDALSRHGG